MANITVAEKYGVEYRSFIQRYIPRLWVRGENGVFKNKHDDWLFSLFKGIRDTNISLQDSATALRFSIRYSGQVLSLEELLNDLFDPNDRGITIDVFENHYWALTGIYIRNEGLFQSQYSEYTPLILREEDPDEFDELPIVYVREELNDGSSYYLAIRGESIAPIPYISSGNDRDNVFVWTRTEAGTESPDIPYILFTRDEISDPNSLYDKDFILNIPTALSPIEGSIVDLLSNYTFSTYLINYF